MRDNYVIWNTLEHSILFRRRLTGQLTNYEVSNYDKTKNKKKKRTGLTEPDRIGQQNLFKSKLQI